MPYPTQERIKQILNYDPETGVFTWMKGTNRIKVGSIAGGPGPHGHIRIMVDGRKVMAHTLAWIYMTGKPPENIIDHRDRNNQNNIFSNLRPATTQQNNFNRSKQRNNTSGVTGVTWSKDLKKWRARVIVDRKEISLGYFSEFDQAVAAREKAKKIHHGEFAV